MSTIKKTPFAVIGAGAAGLVVAIGLAKAGKKVLLIEKGLYGGDCTNYGCIPSKTLIGLAKHHRKDLTFVHKIVSEVRSYEDPIALKKIGVETLSGTASFLSPHLLQVEENTGRIHQIQASKIVIATGSFPQVPPIPGLKETPFSTNETIFDLKVIPKSLIVFGGGPIGCELSQAFQRLGASVHLIHTHSQLLGREPQAASDILIDQFKKEGMVLHLNAKVERVSHSSSGFKIIVDGKEVEGEQLLVSAGRKAQLSLLKLERAKVVYTDQGISIDSYGRTSQKHIFAIGDSTGPPFLPILPKTEGALS